MDKHESARAVKKAELIDNLKRLYPGVVSTPCNQICVTLLASALLLVLGHWSLLSEAVNICENLQS